MATKVLFQYFLVQRSKKARYIKVKVEHYLLFMFSPPKISYTIWGIKYICLHLLTVFYLIQPSIKQIICFDFGKQNSVLPIVLYVLCKKGACFIFTPLKLFIVCAVGESFWGTGPVKSKG
jgi:hypothetical protein